VVDVLRDPLADPLNRRYRPFGEWAQDQMRQPNLFYNRTGTATGTAAVPDRRASATGSTGSPGSGVARSPFATTAAAAPATATPAAAPATTTGGRTKELTGWSGDLLDFQGVPGRRWDPERGWVVVGPVKQGTWLADGIGMPVAYDPTKDTYKWEFNGKPQESTITRAMRWAQGMVNDGKTKSYQNALNFAMANLASDARRGGWADQIGYDANAFRYNQYGEQYNDAIDYANPTVKFGGVPGAAPATPGQPATPATPAATPTTPTTPAPATPGQQTGGPNVADPTAATNPNDPAFKGQYWMTHPQEVADQFVRGHGVNPDQHTAMGDWLLKLVNGIAPDVMSTFFGSNGKPAVDQLSDPNQLLNSIFYNGGGIGQNLQNYAGNAMNVLRGNPTMQQSLGDTGIQDFLSRLNGLNTFGMNPYMAQAYGNAYDSQMNRGLRSQREQLFQGQPLTSLWDFINQAGQPGFSSYGLPGGGGGGVGTGSGGPQSRY